jgi:C-terminal processing protease CtpA/Prc
MLFSPISVVNAQSESEKSFEVLWNTMNDNYASFKEKNIDWDSTYQVFSKQVNINTTEQELFKIFHEMLTPLNDGHLNILAKSIDTAFSASRYSEVMEELEEVKPKERRPLFNKMIVKTLEKENFKPLKEIGPEFRGRKLFAFSDNGKIGYLRFTRCFSKYSKLLKSLSNAKVDKLLNQVFAEFTNLEGLIIDIRFNMGGNDKFSKKVAERFIAKETLSYYKQTRKDKQFGELKSHYIKPKGEEPFLKPTILLTNDQSVSAADVFTLIMNQLPQVKVFGTPSNGSFSDLASKKLPNGWVLTYSNQRYVDLEKKNYEGKGIPVDKSLKNKLKKIQSEEDFVIEEALKELK